MVNNKGGGGFKTPPPVCAAVLGELREHLRSSHATEASY